MADPRHLSKNWELVLGKSQRKLPKILHDIDSVDMFIHDSEHSITCMIFEFELGWEWLEPGGVLIADDISWNDAFQIFIKEKECDSGLIHGNDPKTGYIIK